MSHGSPRPALDLAEPLVDIALPDRMPSGSAFELIEKLRTGGVPVLGGKVRRAGLFSRGMVRLTISVPEKLRADAMMIIIKHLGGPVPPIPR
jgi:hypothetical protein